MPRIKEAALADTSRYWQHSARYWPVSDFAGAFAGNPACKLSQATVVQSIKIGSRGRIRASVASQFQAFYAILLANQAKLAITRIYST